jgi:hypothetical protein
MELLGDVAHVISLSVRSETVLVSEQDRCMVWAKCTIGLEIILLAPNGFLGDDAHVEARFDPFGDSANLDIRLVHCLCRTYHRLRNHFGHTRWNSYVMWVLSNLISVHLETVLVSVQDRCTICAKRRNRFGRTQWNS